MNSTIQKSISAVFETDQLLPEEIEELVLRVGALIYQNIITRSLENMSDNDQDEFEKILDSKNKPEDVFIFLKNKVPNFEEIIKEESEKFRNKSSNIMDKIG